MSEGLRSLVVLSRRLGSAADAGVALQSFENSISDKGFKIALRERNKFRAIGHHA
jgi:hypothetical protein